MGLGLLGFLQTAAKPRALGAFVALIASPIAKNFRTQYIVSYRIAVLFLQWKLSGIRFEISSELFICRSLHCRDENRDVDAITCEPNKRIDENGRDEKEAPKLRNFRAAFSDCSR